MRNYFIIVALHCSLFTLSVSAQQLQVSDLKTEYQENPLNINATAPRLSWKIRSAQRNVMQTAYQIRVGTDSANLSAGKSLVWNSGKLKSEVSVFLPYGGTRLKPNTKYYWQVKVKDNQGKESAWSATNSWRTGLFGAANWSAKWITSDLADTVTGPS
ncbi:MAG: alpha-L-rhamnosidase, partial [Pedobacter sp.]|nr:alpha-L-rhamnosidase [Pedobacter sp.]